MNPRTTFVTLLGWCPGVKAAAKFMPDRDVSNKRIAFSLAIVATVAVSSYFVSGVFLAWAGIPNVSLTKSFNTPILAARDGRLYMSFGQVTQGRTSSFAGPDYLQLSVYFGELKNGTLVNVTAIDNVKWGSAIYQSLLLTRNKTWKIAYSYFLMYTISQYEYSPLYIIESDNGVIWNTPITAYDKPIEDTNPTLIELEGSELFLLFRTNHTWMYIVTKGGAWSEPARTPFGNENGQRGEFLYESAFIDMQGHVNVIWDEGSYEGGDLGLRYSTLVNGVWSKTNTLTSNTVSLNGQQPRIFYSTIRDGYYLTVTSLQQTGSPEWRPVTQLYFSRDLVSWEVLSYFDTWGYSLEELGDGSLARVIEDRGGHNLYYSWSVDGRSWSGDVPIAMIVDEELASSESAYQRSNFSYAISIVVSLAALFILTRVSFM